MTKTLLIVFVFSLMAFSTPAQDKKVCVTRADVLISKDKPTVYITFERTGDSNSGEQPNSQRQYFWLRLHNNTHWAISFPTDSLYVGPKVTALRLCDGRGTLGLKEGLEATIRYEVEAEQGEEYINTRNGGSPLQQIIATPPIISRIDSFSTSWLPSGRSILFKVPREHLVKYLKIYVPFHYEWETEERGNETIEPRHLVYFHASDLPDGIR